MLFHIQQPDGPEEISVAIRQLVIAGWAGRDEAVVRARIEALRERGVAPPSEVPRYYRLSPELLVTAGQIHVLGTDTSGEVEAVLIGSQEGMLVTVGSDHTDRKVEAYSVVVAKQLCLKPVAETVWRYADLAEAWDDLQLAADRVVDGVREAHQRGGLATLRRPEELIAGCFGGMQELPPGAVMFLGALPATGPIAGADRFELSLTDPRTGAALTHGYDVECLPVVR